MGREGKKGGEGKGREGEGGMNVYGKGFHVREGKRKGR